MLANLFDIATNSFNAAGDRIKASALYMDYTHEQKSETPTPTLANTGATVLYGAHRDPGFDASQRGPGL